MTVKESILAAYQTNRQFNRTALAKELGCSRQYLQKVLKDINVKELVQANTGADWEEIQETTTIDRISKGSEYVIDVNSLSINSVDEAIAAAAVDLDKWKEAGHQISSSQVTMKLKVKTGEDKAGNAIIEEEPKTVTNWHVKVRFVPNPERNVIQATHGLIKKIPKFKFSKFRPVNYGSESGYAGIMALIDAHMGKFAWGLEVGRDYDLKIAGSDYLYCTRENLSYMQPFQPEIIYFILGQDIMHTENFEGVTHKGRNTLDTDTRLPKLIEKAEETIIQSITECRKVAPVDVIWSPGNHDIVSSLWMARIVNAYFRDDPYVTVDLGPAKRKCRLWGTTLVGWTHEIIGRYAAWANELAQAFPKEWAASQYREWHHGHKHKKNEIQTSPIVTQGGVKMRQLTALSPIDAWHFEGLFTDAVPGGEAFVMHKTKGMVANFTSWTDHRWPNRLQDKNA